MLSFSQAFCLLCVLFFSIQGQAAEQEAEPDWVKDGRLMLGDDTKVTFRAKDRLKDLDFLDELMRRELRGKYSQLVLQMIKELKLRGLLPDLQSVARERDDKNIFLIINSLTHKVEVKQMKAFYQELKKARKRSSYFGHVEFFDYYNLTLDFSDLTEMFEEGDEKDKERISEYIVLWREKYENYQFSFFVNTALGTAPTSSKIILVNGMRRLPDPEIIKYLINYKICRLDSDKKLAELCKMMSIYSKE